jgi:hypothetical protein
LEIRSVYDQLQQEEWYLRQEKILALVALIRIGKYVEGGELEEELVSLLTPLMRSGEYLFPV